MKKILITGYTSRMVGSTRVRGDYCTFVFLLEDILKDMGYEVERRETKVGEEIVGNYYFAFCGVAPLSSISAHHVMETHSVMQQMVNRHAVIFDDWSACGWGKSVRGVLKDWDRYVKYKKWGYPQNLLDNLKDHLRLMTSINVPGFNAPVLAPMFSWGDHMILMKDNYCANIVTLDPSSYMKFPSINIPNKRNREKRWIMAALSNHEVWTRRQGFNFPVKFVGNVRMPDGVLLSEDSTIQLFANSFGVLSVGYPSAGSGWWRSRYVNAAWAETPIYSDQKDAYFMGKAYQGTAQEFESEYLTPRYDDRVKGQRDWLERHLWTKDEVKAKIAELLG